MQLAEVPIYGYLPDKGLSKLTLIIVDNDTFTWKVLRLAAFIFESPHEWMRSEHPAIPVKC